MSLSKNSKISKANAAEVAELCQNKFLSFQQGMAEYLQAEIADWQPQARVIAQIGSARLLDYGGQGEALLIVPPLINRASILEDFAVAMVSGARVCMIDWDEPAKQEAEFGAAEYASRVMEFARYLAQPAHLLGYCMGGIIALQAALDGDFKSVILVATPWNFAYLKKPAQESIKSASAIPSDKIPSEILQNLFFKLDPFRVFDKFSNLSEKPVPEKQKFFAIEKWVNDGVPMAKKLFVECIESWIEKNDKGLDVSNLSIPVFAACPTRDKIVPLEASLAIASDLPACKIQQYKTGHIGLVIKDILHNDIFSWINGLK